MFDGSKLQLRCERSITLTIIDIKYCSILIFHIDLHFYSIIVLYFALYLYLFLYGSTPTDCRGTVVLT